MSKKPHAAQKEVIKCSHCGSKNIHRLGTVYERKALSSPGEDPGCVDERDESTWKSLQSHIKGKAVKPIPAQFRRGPRFATLLIRDIFFGVALFSLEVFVIIAAFFFSKIAIFGHAETSVWRDFWGQEVSWISLLFFGSSTALCIICTRREKKFRARERQEFEHAYECWKNSWICSKCGAFWV